MAAFYDSVRVIKMEAVLNMVCVTRENSGHEKRTAKTAKPFLRAAVAMASDIGINLAATDRHYPR